jgi:hypothetical protein
MKPREATGWSLHGLGAAVIGWLLTHTGDLRERLDAAQEEVRAERAAHDETREDFVRYVRDLADRRRLRGPEAD